MKNTIPYDNPIELMLTQSEINQDRADELSTRDIKPMTVKEWNEWKDED